MSLFLTAFLAVVGIFVFCALIAEMGGENRPDDYVIPKGWKSRIYDVPPQEGEVELSAQERSGQLDETEERKTDDSNGHPPRRELTSTAWCIIFFVIPYILCLILLTQWKAIEDWWYPDGGPNKQIHGDPPFESREQ